MSSQATKVRFLVLACFCLAAFIAYVQRVSISVAAHGIQDGLGLSKQQMGWVMSGFFWAYALAQIPAGWLGNRWGTRRALPLYVAGASGLCALLAAANGFVSLLAIWSAVGIAIAGIFPTCANSIAKWFPEHERALPSGFLGSFMQIGGAAATALTGFLLVLVLERHLVTACLQAVGEPLGEASAVLLAADWKAIFVLYALPGLLWAGMFFVWFRDRPAEHPSVNREEVRAIEGDAAGEQQPATSGPTPWGKLLTSRRMQMVCGQQFFRAAGYAFFATWFPSYLRESRGVTTAASGYLTSVPLLTMVVGGMLGGVVSDWIQRRTGDRRLSRQLLGAASQYLCGGLILTAYFIDDPVAAVLVIAVGTFVFSFGSCCAYTVTIDIAGPYVATAFGTMNMSGNIGAAISPVVVAWLVDATGWGYVLFFFAAIYAAAGVCWSCLDPRGTFLDDHHV